MAPIPTVLVIGGGFAGAITARELLRDNGYRVVLAEPSPRIGRGVAYGAAEPWHLLNSPAGAMSADPLRSGDFCDWLSRNGLGGDPGDFPPRTVYGDYLAEVWDDTVKAAAERLSVRHDSVIRLRPGPRGVEAGFASGAVLTADQVVLAVGNPRSPGPLPRSLPGHVPNPWRLGALDEIGENPVLLVGTGLTAVDVVLSLRRRGRRAPVTAVSRHGLLPQPHVAVSGGVRHSDPGSDGLAGLVRRVRSAAGADWRPIVDGLRGDLDTLWAGLGTARQERFLDHLARYWEVHRHRMAPPVAAEVDGLRCEGWWRVGSDAILGARSIGGQGIEVRFVSGATGHFGAVVNCTGPARLPSGGNPLVRRLLDEGLARTGPHRLGLDVDPSGRLIDALGRTHERLWTVGALRRGVLWETTAVPEIRAQAAELARRLIEIRRPRAVR